jgi:hypothetical protein
MRINFRFSRGVVGALMPLEPVDAEFQSEAEGRAEQVLVTRYERSLLTGPRALKFMEYVARSATSTSRLCTERSASDLSTCIT